MTVTMLVTIVAGLAALVALFGGYRGFTRSTPGDPDNLRAQSTVWPDERQPMWHRDGGTAHRRGDPP